MDEQPTDSTRVGPSEPKSTPPLTDIQNQLDAGNLHLAWNKLRIHYVDERSQDLTHPAFADLPLLKKGSVFQRLLKAVIDEYCSNSETTWLRPSKVLQRYEQAKLFRKETWSDGLETLTFRVVSILALEDPNPQKTEALVRELMAVWRLFFQRKCAQPPPSAVLDEEWHLTNIKTPNEDSRSNNVRPFERLLHVYHPKFPSDVKISLSALLTFNLFTQQKPSLDIPETLRLQSEPFLKVIAHLLPSGGRNEHLRATIAELEQSSQFALLPLDFRKKLVQQLKFAPSMAMTMIGTKDYAHGEVSSANKSAALEEFFLKRIRRAIESNDERRLASLWEETLQCYKPTKRGATATIPGPIYCAFLSGFLATRRSTQALEIWNHMISNRHSPDVFVWTAMLVGCRKGRDPKAFAETWFRMLQSGIQPDVHAWTERVSGLIEFRRLKNGLQALDEMGRLWRQGEATVNASIAKNRQKITTSSRNPQNPYPKPNITTINATIHAIANLPTPIVKPSGRNEAINKVLSWAGQFDIKPDIITYNTLIRLSLAERDDRKTFMLLRQMEGEGIRADSATFTMLIRTFFDNDALADIPEDERTAKVVELLEGLEARGLKLNAYTYSQTIDRLLHQQKDVAAVRTVLDHMLARGLKPTPVIYTSLIMHYFGQTPPDIASVDSLWTRLTSTPGTVIDKIFFDRMIEGYAKAGEVGKMMSVLVKMGKHGKLPGWIALEAVIRALAQAGDSVRAKAIVKDVLRGEGIAKYGITGYAYGKREFWGAVEELGLEIPEMQKELAR